MVTEISARAKVKLALEHGNGDWWVGDTTIAIDSWGKCWGITPTLRTVYGCTRFELERIWSERRIPEGLKLSTAALDIVQREVIERKVEETKDVGTVEVKRPGDLSG